jgi:hypothetical protein
MKHHEGKPVRQLEKDDIVGTEAKLAKTEHQALYLTGDITVAETTRGRVDSQLSAWVSMRDLE